MHKFDLAINNGLVFLPHKKDPVNLNVGVKCGKIIQLSSNLIEDAEKVFDAKGLMISAGWIDIHTHLYQYATPLGVNPDESKKISSGNYPHGIQLFGATAFKFSRNVG